MTSFAPRPGLTYGPIKANTGTGSTKALLAASAARTKKAMSKSPGRTINPVLQSPGRTINPVLQSPTSLTPINIRKMARKRLGGV